MNEAAIAVAEAEDDGVVRSAGGDVKVINGCRIEPSALCPLVNLTGVDLAAADLTGADLRDAQVCLAKGFDLGPDPSKWGCRDSWPR